MIPDINLKKYKKGITKPVFSNEPYCYEMDLMDLSEHYILFLIGLNNKYMFVFSMVNKDTDNFIYYIDWLFNNGVIIKSRRTDGESFVRAKDCKNYYDGRIIIHSDSLPFSNHNRVCDRVMKTFRDALGCDYGNKMFNNFDIVQELTNYYNNTINKSLLIRGKYYTPQQVYDNIDLEYYYIRQKEMELILVRKELRRRGFLNYKPGDKLMIALSFGKFNQKSINKFTKIRRTFNAFGEFIEYVNGSCKVKIIYPNIGVQHVPLYTTHKLVAYTDEQLRNTFNF